MYSMTIVLILIIFERKIILLKSSLCIDTVKVKVQRMRKDCHLFNHRQKWLFYNIHLPQGKKPHFEIQVK